MTSGFIKTHSVTWNQTISDAQNPPCWPVNIRLLQVDLELIPTITNQCARRYGAAVKPMYQRGTLAAP